jgi:hypothetical protein
VAQRRGGLCQTNLFPLATENNVPKYDYNQPFQQPYYNSFSVRHFGTDKGDDKDKDKDKDVIPKFKNKTPKTDYKKMAVDMVRSGASSTFLFFRHPTLIPSKLRHGWSVVKEEAHHYYVSAG